jgi:hypothetical protein
MSTTITLTVDNPTEALIVEQALAYARQLAAVADTAPDGQVIDRAESVALDQGRNFLRRSLEIAIQSQADAVEKKGRPPAGVTAVTVATTKAK